MRYRNQIKTGRKLYFKNWQRKGYSLFSVIKKAVIIAVVPIIYHTSAEAKNPEITSDTVKVAMEYELEEIEVSSQLAPVTLSNAARMLTIISRREIEAAPVETIQELLEYIPGVDVRKRGGQGVQADISIRGSSFDQVMILLNGIDITDPQTGHHNLNLPVNLDQIQRIEIIEGPASRVFGPNAFAGAINFITNSKSENRIKAIATTGQHGFLNFAISGSVTNGNINHYLSAGKSASSGYIINTDFEQNSLYYNASFGEKNKLFYQMGISDKSFGANSFYTPKYPDQYENTKVFFNALKWEANNPVHLTSSVYWRRHNDRFELFRREAPDWYTNHNFHQTNTIGLNVNGWFENKLGKTAFGINFRNENILSNVLGKDLDDPVEIKNENTQYTKSDSRNTYSVFWEQRLSSEMFFLSFGLMANHISGITNGIHIFPGADFSYNINKSFKFFVTANRSLRAPTFTDLYYNGPTNVGNPDLKPETAGSIEGGIKINSSGFYGNLVFFYRNTKNSIDWVRMEDEEIWHTQNHTQIKSTGFEIGFDYFPGKEKGIGNFISHIKGGYLFNNLSKDDADLVSRYVLDNLKHKFNVSVSHKILNNLNACWKLNVQDRNGTYTEFSNGSYGSEKNYKAFMLLDFKLNYHYNNANIFVVISNIFNKEYVDFGNLPQAGRWIKAGVNLDIKYK